jgi:broad specificity phosphatase PhoE
MKVIHVVRHGQAAHNVAAEQSKLEYLRQDLEDAELTEFGISQCQELSQSAQGQLGNVELVISSPLNRAMQTTTHSFPFLLERGVPWVAVEHIREQTGLHPCDSRRPISEKKVKFPHFNFDDIENDEDILYPKYLNEREPLESVISRGNEFLEWVWERPEKEMVMVTHAAFLRNFMKLVLKMHEDNNDAFREFKNCELRTISLSRTIEGTFEAKYV